MSMSAVRRDLLPCGQPPFQAPRTWGTLFPPIKANITHYPVAETSNQQQYFIYAMRYLVKLVEYGVGHGAKSDLQCGILLKLSDLPREPFVPINCNGDHKTFWEGLLYFLQGLSGFGTLAGLLPEPDDINLEAMLLLDNPSEPAGSDNRMNIASLLLVDFVDCLKMLCKRISDIITQANRFLTPHPKKRKVIKHLRNCVEWLQQEQRNIIDVSGLTSYIPLQYP